MRTTRHIKSLFVVIAVCVVSLGDRSFLTAQEHQSDSSADGDRWSQKNDLLKGLMATPKVIREASAKIEPSLVTIESFGGVSTKAGQIGGIRSQGEGNTTGLVISEDGYVITSLFNFIQQPNKITVKTSDGVRHVADVKGRDATRNICILKIDNVENLQVPEFAPVDEILVGQWAVSVGVGFGDENTAISIGIVSAKNRVGGRAIQTDANISPANYGGPLIDIEGRVIGICVPLSPGSNEAGAGVEWYDSGIGFAVPIHGNESLIQRLKEGVSIEPAYLGIRPSFVTEKPGAVVDEVIKDGPAKAAKLKKGDLIVKIDEHEVIDQTSLRRILNRYSAGDKVTLTILRKPSANQEESEADETEEKAKEVNPESDADSVSNDGIEDHGAKPEADKPDEATPKPDAESNQDSESEPVGETEESVELLIEVELGRVPEAPKKEGTSQPDGSDEEDKTGHV